MLPKEHTYPSVSYTHLDVYKRQSYYSVVGGWVIKYIVKFLSGSGAETAAPGYFDQYIASPAALLIYHAVFLIISFSILILGVQKGIEKTNKILMPALILLSIVIAVKSICLLYTSIFIYCTRRG